MEDLHAYGDVDRGSACRRGVSAWGREDLHGDVEDLHGDVEDLHGDVEDLHGDVDNLHEDEGKTKKKNKLHLCS